ncbi:MAG: tail fiber domain-containing protein [Flavobacterium sp.]|nr:tail fiber domain-containing protein [Flavobacterium sp.]
MKKLLYISLLLFPIITFSQVGIGTTTPNTSSLLDVTDTTKGILIPRMTQAQRNAITLPATGLIIYQTNNSPGFYYYNGVIWVSLSSVSWSTTGNAGTAPATNKVGTTDNQAFILATNNTEAIRVTNTGNVGIGTNNPSTKLHVVSTSSAYQLFNDGFEDNNIPPFTTGGNKNWATQNATVNTGSRAAKSGAITDSQSSWIEYTATIPAQGGTISFAYSTSTESCCDKLRFYIDGAEQNNWGGLISWTTVSFPATAGTHTYRWEYTKDSSVSSNNDQVYLDDVIITINALPTLRIVDGFQSNGKVLISNATGQATWQTPTPSPSSDADWTWNSGSTVADPIYHVGGVFIGTGATTSTYNLKVWNGAATGSRVDTGSIEYLIDDANEIRMSDLFTPQVNNSQDLGSSTNRWTAVYAATGTINTSDERLKENIKPMDYGLNHILQLEPVSFKWKEEKEDDFVIPNEKKELKLGLIAQDVQKVIPDVIVDKAWYVDGEHPENGLQQVEAERLGISYSELIPVTIKAIQEQQNEIDELKKKNEQLKQLITKLKKEKGAN